MAFALTFQHHKSSVLTASKWPQHHRGFLSSSSPWFLSDVRRSRYNTERGEGGKEITNMAHSVTLHLLLLTASLRWECVCLVVPSGENERVESFFGYSEKGHGMHC